MKQINEVQETTGEMDLMELLAYCIAFLRNYARIIIGLFVAGILAGAVLFWILPKLYSSTLLLQPALLTNSEQIQTVNSWKNMLEEKQFDELARMLNTNSDVIKKLRSISAADGGSPSTSRNSNYTAFSINIQVTDRSIISTIQKGILHALGSGQYVNEKLTAQRAYLKAIIQVTSQEINKLDSMRLSIEKTFLTSRSSAGSVIMDVSDINRTSVNLNTRLLQLKDSLVFAAPAHVVQDFYQPDKEDAPKISRMLGMGAIAGLVLGFAVSIYLFLMKNLRNRGLLTTRS